MEELKKMVNIVTPRLFIDEAIMKFYFTEIYSIDDRIKILFDLIAKNNNSNF